MAVKKMTLTVKDKKGIKFIELDPTKKYFLVITKTLGSDFFQTFDNKMTKDLMNFLGSPYIFIVDDVNDLKIEEKEKFLEVLHRKETEEQKTNEK